MRVSKGARWALVVVAAAALVFAAAAAARTHSAAKKGPIVIGWAHDSTGPMAPFDGPALAAAKIELKKVNKKGVGGRKVVIKTCDTQSDNSAASKACADQLISQGAKIIFTTCDVNLAAPVIQESAIKNHLLTVAPCIGTDQMGPKFPLLRRKALLQLRQRRAGRGLGDGRSRMEARLEDRRPREGQRRSSTSRPSSTPSRHGSSSSAARSSSRRRTRIHASSRARSTSTRRLRRSTTHPAKVIVTATAGAYGALGPFMDRPADGEQQHARAQLLGGRRNVLDELEGHELLVRDVRERVRPRPEQGREQAREGDESPSRDRRVHHRAGRARRRRPGDQAGTRLAGRARSWRL